MLPKAIESCGKRSRLQTLLSAALLREKLPLVSFFVDYRYSIGIRRLCVPRQRIPCRSESETCPKLYLVDWLSGYSGVASQSCTFHADSSFQSGLLDPVSMRWSVEEFVHFAELMVLERQVQAMVDFCQNHDDGHLRLKRCKWCSLCDKTPVAKKIALKRTTQLCALCALTCIDMHWQHPSG